MKNKEKYINEILEYQDILRAQIEREDHDFNGALSEKESVYNDINNYCDEHFDGWYTKDFIQYIKYLEKLTQIKNKLGL